MDMTRIQRLQELAGAQTPDIEGFARITRTVREETQGMEEMQRKVHFLNRLAEELPTPVFAEERILGSMRFWHSRSLENPAFYNLGHIVVDYGSVLKAGLGKLEKTLRAKHTPDAETSAESVKALARLIIRYAEAAEALAAETGAVNLREAAAVCRHIATAAPGNFLEAVQLVWFVHLFLHAEGMNAAVSFGRFDMYMDPYYKEGIESGKLTREDAAEILACLWIKTCEGDESQNLILGGEGENELSCLCMEVTRRVRTRQPSLSARIGEHTSKAFMEEVIRLVKSGLGMPAIFNDRVVEKALMALGIPEEDARQYAIVGCYEANPPQALGLTVASGVQLHTVLLRWLPGAVHTDFAACVADFEAYFTRWYHEHALPEMKKGWQDIQTHMASPFESACIASCVESGRAAEHKGARYTMFGVDILGLGTLVDSLHAVKKMVFEGGMDYDAFVEQVLSNFPDRGLSEKCKNLPGKYGTDNPETNALAERLSAHIARTVIDNRLEDDVITYPGLFQFTADIYSQSYPATPDGRLAGERLSYGVAASDFCSGKTATSTLNSAAHASNDLCACGNPVMLYLSQGEVEGERGDMVIESLIRGFFDKGGFHVQFNVGNADILREAQQMPDQHRDLMIRISGFSAQFVELNPTLQDALIERSK